MRTVWINDYHAGRTPFGRFADKEFSSGLAMNYTMRFFSFELPGGHRLTWFFGEPESLGTGR